MKLSILGNVLTVQLRHFRPLNLSLPPGSSKKPSSPNSGSRICNALRRMIFTSMAIATSYYAIGVLTEYFRAGGKDSHRIDGFTTFKSELASPRVILTGEAHLS